MNALSQATQDFKTVILHYNVLKELSSDCLHFSNLKCNLDQAMLMEMLETWLSGPGRDSRYTDSSSQDKPLFCVIDAAN